MPMEHPLRHIIKEQIDRANLELAALCPGGRDEVHELAQRGAPFFTIDATHHCEADGSFWLAECGDIEKNLILKDSGRPAELRSYYDRCRAILEACAELIKGRRGLDGSELCHQSQLTHQEQQYQQVLNEIHADGGAALLPSLIRLFEIDLRIASEAALFAVGRSTYLPPELTLIPRLTMLLQQTKGR